MFISKVVKTEEYMLVEEELPFLEKDSTQGMCAGWKKDIYAWETTHA